MSTRSDRLLAHVIRATLVVDRAARRFDQVRSALVTRIASPSVLDAYNDLAYERTPVYLAGSPDFRFPLFNWESEAIALTFPDPPARVLIGGAGGGREAFALAARGYQVVAFEPSAALARSMVEHAPAGVSVEALIGRYEDLPELTSVVTGARLNVRQLGPFDAAIFGWSSYSHLRTRAARVAALRDVGEVTHGPMILSYFSKRPRPAAPAGLLRAAASALGFKSEGDLFTPVIGFYHLSSSEELEIEAREAGLERVHASLDELDGRWPYLVVQRVSSPGQKRLTSIRQDAAFTRSGESART